MYTPLSLSAGLFVNNDIPYLLELQALRGFYNILAEAQPAEIGKSLRAPKDPFALRRHRRR
jgi:hypothetical protein